MKENFNTLRQRATQIKNEVEDGANTSARVGSFCEDVVDTMTGTITEYNVSVQHPTSGIDGSNKYSLEGAIAQVPPELRNIGLKVSFVNSAGQVEIWEYQGGAFTNAGNWMAVGGKKLVELENFIYNFSDYDLTPLIDGGNASFKKKTYISENEFDGFSKFSTQDYKKGTLWFNLSTKTDDNVTLLAIKAKCYAGSAKIVLFNSDEKKVKVLQEVDVIEGVNIIPCSISLKNNEYVTITNCYARNSKTAISVQTLFSEDVVSNENYKGNFEIAFQALYKIDKTVNGINDISVLQEDINSNTKNIANNKLSIESLKDTDSNIIENGGVGTIYTRYTKTLPDESYASSWPNKLKMDGGNGNIFFNQVSLITSNCKLYNVKAKTKAGEILFYKYNNKTNEFSKIATKNATTDGINEFDFSTDEIELIEGEYISCSNIYYKLNVSTDSIQLTFSDDGSSITSINKSASFNLFFEFTTDKKKEFNSLIQLKEAQDSLFENVKSMTSGSFKSCTLFTDNFSQDDTENWEYSNWSLVENKVTATGYGESSKLKSKRKYFLDKRKMKAAINLANDSFVKIDCTASWNEGASCFGIDIHNRKLIIYKAGSGLDNQSTSQGYTSEELESSAIEEDVINADGEYTIELVKDSTNHTLKLINDRNGKYSTVSHNGWGAGRQNEQYGFYAISGTYPKITFFGVYGMENPDVVFTGDSQTEGVYVFDRSKRYAELYRTQNIGLKVAISAKGGAKIQDIIDMFDYEYRIIKPKKMSLLIGANDIIHKTGTEVFEQKLRVLKNLCDSINCQLIINRIACVHVNGKDGHIEYNEIIDKAGNEFGLCSAKFDNATAINNIPYVDESNPSPRYNSELYGDKGLHPNVNGNIDMYQRLLTDIPIL